MTKLPDKFPGASARPAAAALPHRIPAWIALVLVMAATAAHAAELESMAPPVLVDEAERQLDAQEYDAASELLTTAVSAIEARGDRYSPDLVQPLTLLGDALRGEGEHERAVDTYNRALHIKRISSGLHDPDQVDIVYRQADTWVALGDYERAGELQEYAYEIMYRTYGDDDLKLIPGLYKLADWYTRTYNIFSARGLYEHAVTILEDAHGETDERLIPALSGLANSYRLEKLPPYRPPEPTTSISFDTGPVMPSAQQRRIVVNRYGKGKAALHQIMKIRQADPDATPDERAAAALDIADWNLIFEEWDTAEIFYRRAREILVEDSTAEDVDAMFAEPRPIHVPMPTPPGTAEAQAAGRSTEPGYVEFSYSVNTKGRTYNVSTLDAEPPELLRFQALRALRRAIFRPRITAAGAEPVEDLVFRHSYEYVPEVPRAVRDEAPAEAQAAAITGQPSLNDGSAAP